MGLNEASMSTGSVCSNPAMLELAQVKTHVVSLITLIRERRLSNVPEGNFSNPK